MNEQELVVATLHGNMDAYGQLARQYHRPLVATARQLTGSTDDAEDLAQETLLEAYRRLPVLRDPASFRSWLFVILRNKCLRHLERQKPTVPLDELPELPLPSMPVDAYQLLDMLDRMPLQDREILAAHYLHDLSFDEVAAALGITAATARMRCSRARKRLRVMAEQAQDEEMRQLMQSLVGIMLPSSSSDAFVDRILQEVTPMTTNSLATGTTVAATAPTPSGAMAALGALTSWKVATGVIAVLALGTGGTLVARNPQWFNGNDKQPVVAAAAPTAAEQRQPSTVPPEAIQGDEEQTKALQAVLQQAQLEMLAHGHVAGESPSPENCQRMIEKVEPAVKKYTRADPRFRIQADMVVAHMYGEIGQKDKAMAMMTRIVDEYRGVPGRVSAISWILDNDPALQGADRWGKVERKFINTRDAEEAYEYARYLIYTRTEDSLQARRAVYQHYLQRYGERKDGHHLLYELALYTYSNDHEHPEMAYQIMQDLFTTYGNGNADQSYPQREVTYHIQFGHIAQSMHKYDEAIAAYDWVISAYAAKGDSVQLPRSRMPLLQAYEGKAITLLSMGKNAEAVECQRKVEELRSQPRQTQ